MTVGQSDLNGVMLIGGSQIENFNASVRDSALVYDVENKQFSGVVPLVQQRQYHSSVELLDGTVLVAGGLSGDAGTELATAELDTPSTGSFQLISNDTNCPGQAGCMISAGNNRTATRLADGRVLFAGGQILDGNGQYTASLAEIYDPATRTFHAVGSMTTPREYHTATLMPNGKVLIVGGRTTTPQGTILGTSEIFDPATEKFAAAEIAPFAAIWSAAT